MLALALPVAALPVQPRTSSSVSSRPTSAPTSHTSTSPPSTIRRRRATFGRRYLFAELEQHTFELATRVDWTLSPRLSFQLYLQPFVASGDYHDPHALVAAGTRDYEPWPTAAPEPDFNLRSLRGSAVLRWEFRPGSTLYVAWNENRAGVDAERRLRSRPRPRARSPTSPPTTS